MVDFAAFVHSTKGTQSVQARLSLLDGSAVPAGLQPLILLPGELSGFPITLFRFTEQGSGPSGIRSGQ